MYSRMIRLALVCGLLVGPAALLVHRADPATAQPVNNGPCGSCGNVAMTPDGLLAAARSQMDELNGAEARREPCTDDAPQYAGHTGYIRWRLTAVEQETWDRIYNGDETTTWYRQECYFPEVDQVYGVLLDVQEFDAISPQTIAQVAIDDMLTAIPTQMIRTSPGTDAMVAIPTWFWVDGVPVEGVSATASVPGINVVATATPGGVNYDFGDQTTKQCAGSGTPYAPGASSDCTHDYQRAGNYTITATILWTGSYTVNGQGPYPITTAVPRTDTIILAVNEAQAINTGSGGG
jgi:hypothetical protein